MQTLAPTTSLSSSVTQSSSNTCREMRSNSLSLAFEISSYVIWLFLVSLSLSCSLFLPSAQRWEKQVRAPTMWHHWPSQGVTTWCKKKGCVPHRLPLIILPTDELLIYASPTTEMLLPNEHDSNNITHRELCRHKFTHSSGGIKQCW